MIPKKIHYCWFGGSDKPRLAQRCIASWKKYCPDYEIIEWNEQNFDVTKSPYASYCLRQKQWAFLSDFVRLAVIKEYGGLYFDTDVELLNHIDLLLHYDAFYGFETSNYIATGLGFGAQPGHPTVCAMYDQYLALQPEADGSYALVPCPQMNTQALLPYGLKLDGSRQSIAGAEILPVEFLNPYDDPTGRIQTTANTLSVHWYAKSWMKKRTIVRSKMTKPFHRLFGVDCFRRLKKGLQL